MPLVQSVINRDSIKWMYKGYIAEMLSIFHDGLTFILMLLSCWSYMYCVWVCVELCDVFRCLLLILRTKRLYSAVVMLYWYRAFYHLQLTKLYAKCCVVISVWTSTHCWWFNLFTYINYGPGSSVSIATDYGLDGSGIESRWGEIFRPSRPALGLTQPPVQWVPCLSWG